MLISCIWKPIVAAVLPVVLEELLDFDELICVLIALILGALAGASLFLDFKKSQKR